MSLQIGTTVYAKEYPPTYILKPQVEKLCEFLIRERKGFSDIIPLTFLVEQVYIQHNSRKPANENVHWQLIEKMGFDKVDQLPKLYREFYFLLEAIFAQDQQAIKDAIPFLFEKLSAVAFESRYNCLAGNNRKLFRSDGTPLRYNYYDLEEKKPRFKDEVDTLTVPKSNDNHAFAECKTSVTGFTKSLSLSYSFLDYLSNEVANLAGCKTVIVFIFPVDRSKHFNELIAKVSHQRVVFAMSLINWKKDPEYFNPR